MPATPVDLTAILPALREAAAPFDAAMAAASKIRVNPATSLRAFAPVAGLTLTDMQKLIDAIGAVRRMAGDIK